MRTFFLSLLLCPALVVGCAQGNRVESAASSGYYPHYPQTEREWKQVGYEVYASANTPPGRHYGERTPKTLQVQLYRRGVVKRTLQYEVVGAAINWEVTWSGPGHATLHVYDYPDHVQYYMPHARERRREILTVRYDYNERSGTYRAHLSCTK